MTPTVFNRLETMLQAAGVAFTAMRHAPVYTSEEAAAVRGTALGSGAKALVMKIGDAFKMLVVPADRKVDSKKVRTVFACKSSRFASREEVEKITGLQPGSIPPFGSLFGLPTTCDPALGRHERINFNAGDHSISMQMTFEDYVGIEKPGMELIATEQQ